MVGGMKKELMMNQYSQQLVQGVDNHIYPIFQKVMQK